MEKIVIRLFQERYRSPEESRLWVTQLVGTFTNEFDAKFFVEQATKQKHYGWTDIINEKYIMLNTYPCEKGGTINEKDRQD